MSDCQKKAEATAELQALGRFMMEKDLVWGNAGNISVRLDHHQLLITASGSHLGELASTDVVVCPLQGVPDGGARPSKELPMHQAVYQQRPEVRAVIHSSPFFSTLMACSQQDIPNHWFVEAMYYLERVERVPYCHPGSSALEQAVRQQTSQSNVLLLNNHGVLVYDTNVKEARAALETLELTCRMVVQANAAGVNMAGLEPDVVADFLENANYRPRRRWAK